MNGKTHYNERSWAIDVIQEITKWANQRSVIIKRAGGETSLNAGRGSLFPDVLLYGDKSTITNILQGWELNPPETGILGVGAYQTTPVYDDGHWVPKKILPLSLTFDHRIVDGAPAAQFLQEIKKGLENPLQLLI